MSIKQNIQQYTGNFKAVASIVPHLNKIVKSKSEDEIFEALIDDQKFDDFMSDVYNKLPPHVKMKISKDKLVPHLQTVKAGLLKKKKFRKKIEDYNKSK